MKVKLPGSTVVASTLISDLMCYFQLRGNYVTNSTENIIACKTLATP